MAFNADKHSRRSIRLRDHDYSREGAYFVTLCTFSRQCVLGDVSGGEVLLNALGDMVTKWWSKLVKKFPWSRRTHT